MKSLPKFVKGLKKVEVNEKRFAVNLDKNKREC